MSTIGIIKEDMPGETRVAAVPDTVAKMIAAKLSVQIQAGAGERAYLTDDAYTKAGASIVENADQVLSQATVLLKVRTPDIEQVKKMQPGSILIAPLAPAKNADLIQQLATQKVTAFALDLLPRIARAQSMDILSSMSNLAGYKSVILSADYLPKIFPMMTTAAGTILPAKVIVIGAGVAGLQAIATARRLGAVVIAFDTRPAAGEQIKSLGAEFVSMETSHETAQDAGGYAKEQTEDFYKNEQEIIRKYSKEADVIITTALIPGKRAPILITEDMVKEMKPGSVIVDLSVEQQGNCVLSELGKIVTKHNVTIIGLPNLATTLPVHASQLFSKNLLAFLTYILPQIETQEFDMSDDIIQGCLLMKKGEKV
jgi:H+-translocating NAD(P) transhydrogenase subunit alpha